jgi:hypothetical protein
MLPVLNSWSRPPIGTPCSVTQPLTVPCDTPTVGTPAAAVDLAEADQEGNKVMADGLRRTLGADRRLAATGPLFSP